jgi:hypothetical protein
MAPTFFKPCQAVSTPPRACPLCWALLKKGTAFLPLTGTAAASGRAGSQTTVPDPGSLPAHPFGRVTYTLSNFLLPLTGPIFVGVIGLHL